MGALEVLAKTKAPFSGRFGTSKIVCLRLQDTLGYVGLIGQVDVCAALEVVGTFYLTIQTRLRETSNK